MSNDDNKIITGICPFQTQLGQIPRTDRHAQMILGPQQIPLVKLSCDREKCQLYSTYYHMCAVSAILFLMKTQYEDIQNLQLIIQDVNAKKEGKPTPSGGASEN